VATGQEARALDVDRIRRSVAETVDVLGKVGRETAPKVSEVAGVLVDAIRAGGKLLVCGNGGSAADSQHIAAELGVRYLRDRKPIPAIALTVDTSVLTAAANDVGFEQVFARQVEALGRAGDVLLAISTSGLSPNVLRAVEKARELGLVTVGLTGDAGGELAGLVDHCIAVPSRRTPRIQEAHLVIEHLLCEALEEACGE
jgi:D-sedoheptulose 7-phosphate isomerase